MISLLALQLAAQAAAAPLNWIAFNFDVFQGCPPLSKTEQLYFQYGAKHLATVFTTRLDHPLQKSKPIRMRLVCDEKLFYTYQQKHFGKVIGGGYYFKNKDNFEMHLLYRPGDKELSKGLFHEMTHHIVNSRAGNKQPEFPFWFNEGIAGYFGNAQPALHNLRVVISRRNQTIEKWVEQQRYPTLRTFFKLSPEQWSNWDYTRDISESLFHFLMESREGNRVVSLLLKAGYAHVDLETTLARAYPGGLDRLQFDWQNWLKIPRNEHLWSDLP